MSEPYMISCRMLKRDIYKAEKNWSPCNWKKQKGDAIQSNRTKAKSQKFQNKTTEISNKQGSQPTKPIFMQIRNLESYWLDAHIDGFKYLI